MEAGTKVKVRYGYGWKDGTVLGTTWIKELRVELADGKTVLAWPNQVKIAE